MATGDTTTTNGTSTEKEPNTGDSRKVILIVVNVILIVLFLTLIGILLKVKYCDKKKLKRDDKKASRNKHARSNEEPTDTASNSGTLNKVFKSGTRIWRTTRDIDDDAVSIASNVSERKIKAYLVSKEGGLAGVDDSLDDDIETVSGSRRYKKRGEVNHALKFNQGVSQNFTGSLRESSDDPHKVASTNADSKIKDTNSKVTNANTEVMDGAKPVDIDIHSGNSENRHSNSTNGASSGVLKDRLADTRC